MEQHTAYRLNLTDFSRLELGGVKEVLGFDETQIELSLKESVLLIGGKDLKIESFSREKGEIFITGTIDSVFREEEGSLNIKKPFYKRFFS